MSSPGWWDVTGGKLTTYRLMAEETVDQIARHVGRPVKPCSTASLPLVESNNGDSQSGVLPPPVEQSVVAAACEHEWARHLDDVMIRRTSWRYYHRDHREFAVKVADWMGEALGWSEAEKREELARYEGM
jgi:glycerol-3-phosphate dehydrogenase